MAENTQYGWGWLLGVGLGATGVGLALGWAVGRGSRTAPTATPASLPASDGGASPPTIDAETGTPDLDTGSPGIGGVASPPPLPAADPALVQRLTELFGDVAQRQTLPLDPARLAAFTAAIVPSGAAFSDPLVATLQRQLVALGYPADATDGAVTDATRQAWQRYLRANQDWYRSELAACAAAGGTRAEQHACLLGRGLARIDSEFGRLAARAQTGGA